LATAAVLKHDAGLPYRKISRLLDDLCGLRVSPGALPKQMRRMGQWLAEPGEVPAKKVGCGRACSPDFRGT